MIENFAEISRFNFWDSMLETGFRRSLYLERLKKFNTSSLVRVLVGQRRVGKSYLLRQVIADLINNGVAPRNTLYINMEYLEYGFIKTADDLVSTVKKGMELAPEKGSYHLFIDEVQLIQDWEKAINSLSQDFTLKINIYLTGSNARLLSGELATLLSGRYVKLLILPFSFKEYASLIGQASSRKLFLEYMQSGGMPELFRLPDLESRRNYMAAVYDTILLRDIVQRHQVRDIKLLQDIFAFVANNSGNLFSINSLVNFFKGQKRKTNYETVAAYLRHLEDAFLIHRCERFNIKGKELLKGEVKYYLNDLSFKNFLFPAVFHGWGYVMENLVFLELLNHGLEVFVGYMREKEVDFVVKKEDGWVYIQSAFQMDDSETRNREYAPLLAIPDQHEKWVVSADELIIPSFEGIRHKLVWQDWLAA
jgi:predicted AAA+ superfamily ATPase